MNIEFGRLYFASTFTDPHTGIRWVKQDEEFAEIEDPTEEQIHHRARFYPNDIVEV